MDLSRLAFLRPRRRHAGLVLIAVASERQHSLWRSISYGKRLHQDQAPR